MFEQIKIMFAGLKTAPLPTVCGLLIITVSYLWMDIRDTRSRWDKRESEYRIESVEREKKCAEQRIDILNFYRVRLDSIAERELRKSEKQLKEMNAVIDRLNKRKR